MKKLSHISKSVRVKKESIYLIIHLYKICYYNIMAV